MNNLSAATFRALIIGVVIGSVAFFNGVAAESQVFRFEAERSMAGIAPPKGSFAASVASMRRLTGMFGFDSSIPIADGAGIPGRVSFGAYDTGFVSIDGIDSGKVPGKVSVTVTDGVTQSDDPRMTIVDEISLSTQAVSTHEPVDALTLRVRYLDAERLQSVDLPEELLPDDIGEMSLTFSTRIDAMSNRSEGQRATGDLLGLVRFDITVIEKVE
ncbi:MAG: hypothetical protein PVI15_07580 [Chromatiales bacterium]|jgi:hypothetical protein